MSIICNFVENLKLKFYILNMIFAELGGKSALGFLDYFANSDHCVSSAVQLMRGAKLGSWIEVFQTLN